MLSRVIVYWKMVLSLVPISSLFRHGKPVAYISLLEPRLDLDQSMSHKRRRQDTAELSD